MASAADGDRRGTPEPGRRRGGARGCRGVRPCAGRAVAVVQRARTGGRVLPAARAGDLRVGLHRRAASDTAPENVARRSALTEPGPDVISSDPMPVPTTGGAVRDEAGFRAFVEANGATLLHAARLMTGDHHRGEDLVQTALTKGYPKWGRIAPPLPYARKALVNAHIDQSRRRWWGERPTETLPEPADDHARSDEVASESRDELRRILAGLAPKERAVIVLRYYCDLSEQDTAATLGVPVGTVKSTCSRAPARLRVEATSGARGWHRASSISEPPCGTGRARASTPIR